MAEKNSLWRNIRNKAKQNRRTGATPKQPTTEMLRQKREIKAKKAEGGPVGEDGKNNIPKTAMTYNDNRSFYDSHAVIPGNKTENNPEYNEWVKKMVYEGKIAYDPTTGKSYPLNNKINIPEGRAERATEAYTKKPVNERLTTNKDARKDAVMQSMIDVGNNPAFYAPGVIAASPFVGPAAAAASTAMSAPLSVGATTIPWLTAGDVVGAGFALKGAYNLGQDLDSGYYTSNTSTGDKIARGVGTSLDLLSAPRVLSAVGTGLKGLNPLSGFKSSSVRNIGDYEKGLKKIIPEEKYLTGEFNQHAFKELKKAALAFSPSTTKALGRLDDNIARKMLSDYRFGKYSSVKDFRKSVKKSILESERLKKIHPTLDFGKLDKADNWALADAKNLKQYADIQLMVDKSNASQKSFMGYLGKDYNKKMGLINQNKVFKNIADESPQYTDIIYEHLKNPKVSDDEFVTNLVKQSNTFTRAIHNPVKTQEEFLTLKGRSLGEGSKNTVDVEGFPVSEKYGDYRYKMEPNAERMAEISATPIEQRWAQRFPQNFTGKNENVGFKEGWHNKGSEAYNDWWLKRLNRNRAVNNVPMIKYPLDMSVPHKYINYPQHSIFNSELNNQSIKGFDVSRINIEDPYKYVPGFTRGFAKGGNTMKNNNQSWKDYLQYADGGPGCPVRPMDTLKPLPAQLISTADTPLNLNNNRLTSFNASNPERQMVMLHQRNQPVYGVRPENNPAFDTHGGAGLEYNMGNGKGWQNMPQGEYINKYNSGDKVIEEKYPSYLDYLKQNSDQYNVQGGYAQGGYTNPYNQYQKDPYLNYAGGGYMYAGGGRGWKKFGNTMADIGLGIGDVVLGSVGSVTGIKSLQDTIGTDQYHNDDFDTGANFVGKLAGTALKYIPVTAPFAAAAGVVGGVANAAIGIDRKNYDPSKHQTGLDKAGDIVNFAGDVGTMFVDPTKAANTGAAAAKAGKTTAAAANTANTVGKIGQAASTTADVVDTAVKVGEVANTANQIGQAASTTADVVNTASNIADTAQAAQVASNIGEVAAAAAPAAGALTTAATVAPATTTAANAISAAAKPVVDSSNKLSSGLKYGEKYYEAVEASNKISKYGNIAQTALSVGQPFMQQKQQQQQKQVAESTMGNEPMYPKPDANAAYAGITTPTFNTGTPVIGDNINTSNQFFSQGGNITNNSLNLRNTMRYKRFAQGGTLEQQGINFITEKAGLHYQNANGGVPIGPDALAEGGEAKLQMADGGQYIVSGEVDGANTQSINGETMTQRLKKKLKPFMMGGLASNPRDKDALRRPFDSYSAESIAQAKEASIQETEAIKKKTGGALQYAAHGGKITPEIKKLVEAERKRLAQEEYSTAYNGIDIKKHGGLNYSRGGKVSNRNVQEFAKQILASKGGYVHNQMTQPMLAEGGPIYGDPASPYTYAYGGMYGNPYAEGGIDGILPTQPITYRTTPGQQMDLSSINPMYGQMPINLDPKNNYANMPRPDNPGIILEAEEEEKERYSGDRLTIGGEGTYTREKAVPVEEDERVDLNSPAFRNAINASLNGTLNLGKTGDFKIGADAALNYATPEEGGVNMLKKNPGVTGTFGGNIAYDKNGNAFKLGVNYNTATNALEGKASFNKSFPSRKARGGQIDYTNDMYSMYAGGGPMVSNVNQPFNGPTAQNRGGMYVYADGGMMSPEQQMMQQQQMQQQQAPQQQMQQQGGQDQMMQMVQQVMEALMQGANPEQIMQQLVQSGVPQEQAQQIVQVAMQEAQGQMQQQQGQPMQEGQQMPPQQGMARGGMMYAGGGPEGGPGDPPRKRLYDTALEQQKYLLDNNAWQNDPEMVKPDGSFNLCLDCINVDWNNEDDIKDAHRLIEEGLSLGTHYSQEQFKEGLKKFNIPEPIFNRVNQPVSQPAPEGMAQPMVEPMPMPQTHATGGMMYPGGGYTGREKRRHNKMMRTSPAYRNYYNSAMGNKNIISDNALYSIPGIQDMTEQEIANYTKQETKVPTVDNPNNPATAITEAEARLHGWEPAVFNNATGWNSPAQTAQPIQGPWQPGISGTENKSFYGQFNNDDIAYSNYLNGTSAKTGPLANNQLTEDDKAALAFQEKYSQPGQMTADLIDNQSSKKGDTDVLSNAPEKLFEPYKLDVTPTVYPNKGLEYTPDKVNLDDPAKKSKLPIGDIAVGAAQMLGYIDQLNQSKDYDRVKYPKADYKELNPTSAIIASDKSQNKMYASTAYGVKQNAPSSRSYLSNMLALTGQAAESSGNASSSIRRDYDQMNANAYNRNQEYNTNVGIEGMRDEAANKGVAATNRTDAYTGMGNVAGNMYRNYKQNEIDKTIANNIGTANWKLSSDGKLIIYRDTQTGKIVSKPVEEVSTTV